MRSHILVTVFLVGCAGGTSFPAVDVEADKAAIRAQIADAVAAHNAADAEAWANVSAEDIVFMVDGGPSISGRAAITDWIREFYAANRVSDMTAEALEIEIAGDWAYSRDHVSAMLTPPAGGEPVRLDVKEIVIWRRQADGTWRAWRSIFNSNTPPEVP